MIIKNINVVLEDHIKPNANIILEGKKIKSINNDYVGNPDIDGTNLYCLPGFIDIHTHGTSGYDFTDDSAQSAIEIKKAVVKEGTTSLLGTTLTASIEKTRHDCLNILNARKESEGARLLGIHLEGPFINKKRIGAQNPNYLLEPNVDNFKELTDGFEDFVRIVSLAPELDQGFELIQYLTDHKIVSSVAHSDASYECVNDAAFNGLKSITHMYNCQSPLNHRDPGVVGAALLNDSLFTELIVDRIHVSEPIVRLTYRTKGYKKLVLITDSMMAKHLDEGQYKLGELNVTVKHGEARLDNGALAGSVLKMNEACKNIMEITNCSLVEVSHMASLNQAKLLKIDNLYGSIKPNKIADLVIVDEEMNVHYTIVDGKIAYQR